MSYNFLFGLLMGSVLYCLIKNEEYLHFIFALVALGIYCFKVI